jgi:hypothetical protein
VAFVSCALTLVSCAFCGSAFAQSATSGPTGASAGQEWSPGPELQLLLSTDFEGASVEPAKAANKQTDMLSVKLPTGQPAQIPIFYESGNASGRFAKVIPDPTSPSNHVLQFWLKDAQVKGQRAGYSKGRVQLAFSQMQFTEAAAKFRMYLPPDLEAYRSFPEENTWFTIDEMWFGARWEGDSRPFRITISIVKPKGAGQPLYFAATGERAGTREGQWVDVWHAVDPSFEVPIGQWMDMELGYRQGDAATGRFYLAVKRSSDPKSVRVLDVKNWTYHPDAAQPVPMTSWNPLKVYTSEAIIDHVSQTGGAVQVLFDDFEVRAEGKVGGGAKAGARAGAKPGARAGARSGTRSRARTGGG